jgi:xanthine dehydrogenase iron-sulfur cluster and FAD-binding subunit A
VAASGTHAGAVTACSLTFGGGAAAPRRALTIVPGTPWQRDNTESAPCDSIASEANRVSDHDGAGDGLSRWMAARMLCKEPGEIATSAGLKVIVGA